MLYEDEKRDVILEHSRLLIQRGSFIREIDAIDNSSITGINTIVDFDYMGSSEFEWGALPRSLRRITLNKDFYSVIEFPEYKDKFANGLKIYAPRFNLESIKKEVARLVVTGYGLKEYCSLCDFIVKDNVKNVVSGLYKDNNFWWDIDNDFFMFFEHTDKILIAMERLGKRKFGYENAKPKAALSDSAIKILANRKEKPYSDYLIDFSLIGNYNYNKKNGIHFIEFLPESKIENVLMEAMLISKVDLGQVIFEINGIDFNINGSTTLIDILSQSGINLADKVISSKTVDTLVAEYQKNELCFALKPRIDN